MSRLDQQMIQALRRQPAPPKRHAKKKKTVPWMVGPSEDWANTSFSTRIDGPQRPTTMCASSRDNWKSYEVKQDRADINSSPATPSAHPILSLLHSRPPHHRTAKEPGKRRKHCPKESSTRRLNTRLVSRSFGTSDSGFPRVHPYGRRSVSGSSDR